MNISLKKGDVFEEECDVLVLGAFQVDKLVEMSFEDDGGFITRLLEHMNHDQFKAKEGNVYVYRAFDELPANRVLVVGLGKREEITAETVRIAAGAAFNKAKSFKVKKVIVDLLGLDQEISAYESAQSIVEGTRLADYTFAKYKKDEGKSPEDVVIMTEDGRVIKTLQRGIDEAEQTSIATTFARDLVNTPGNEMHPDKLVETARELAKGKSEVRVRVYDQEQLEKMGAGGIVGVGQGSEKPSYLVHMIYKPEKATKKKVCLVGKAVTFDSGGLSLKPKKSMTTMKVDMGGAAAVLAVFSVIDQIAPQTEVLGIFAPVENMPSGDAVRPGDVLRMLNKKTVEVLDTDAEGRLTLADLLVYAEKQKPDFIIELATLTGACVVALGEEITAVMSNNAVLANKILSAAAKSGEKMWEMPLEKNYKKLIKSEIADVKNIGNGWGGALTAGLFLQEFVVETPWAHLDISGPVYAERVINSYTKKGATGHGVRTLIELLRNV